MKKMLGILLSLTSFSLSSMELVPTKSELSLRKEHNHFIKLNIKNKMHVEKDKMLIDERSLFVPEKLGKMELYHNKQGFSIRKDDQTIKIQKYFTDPMVRDLDKKQLKAFLEGGYLTINEIEGGEYSLKSKIRLNGSGALGAAIGACIGKVTVSLVGHGTIFVIGLCTGPAMPATIIALESAFGPAIELASIKGAIAGGIALGVATGPV